MYPTSDQAEIGRALEAAYYGDDAERIVPETREELVETLRGLEDAGRSIIPAGLGTHAYLGNLPRETPAIVSAEKLASIIAYEPEDYTIAVGAGLRLSELRAALLENGQELACDITASSRGTIGGLVAAGIPGPRRASTGALRTLVIGIHGVRSSGRAYKAGGMVVKNVAGYEIGKFLCGALGTAGCIERVNLKLRARPALRLGARVSFPRLEDAWAFSKELRDSRLEPAVLTLLEARSDARAEELVPENLRIGFAAHVFWIFEGNSTLAESLHARANDVLEATGVREFDREVLEGERAESVLDRLTAIREPVDAPVRSEAIVRASVLPGRARSAFESVRSDLLAQGLDRLDLFADVMSGQLWFAVRANEGELEQATRIARDRTKEAAGVAWLHYAPKALREKVAYLLTEDRNRDAAGKILRVFDHEGRYCPGRVMGS